MPDPRIRRFKSTILVVDDEPEILDAIVRFFEKTNDQVRVFTAPSGAKALELLGRGGIDLLVVDYRMPGMDGLELLRRADAVAPKVPRIMMTAYPDAELATRASVEGGCSMLISKPFDMFHFVETVAHFVDKPTPLRG